VRASIGRLRHVPWRFGNMLHQDCSRRRGSTQLLQLMRPVYGLKKADHVASRAIESQRSGPRDVNPTAMTRLDGRPALASGQNSVLQAHNHAPWYAILSRDSQRPTLSSYPRLIVGRYDHTILSVRRRELITLLGGAAVMAPRRYWRSRCPVIGFPAATPWPYHRCPPFAKDCLKRLHTRVAQRSESNYRWSQFKMITPFTFVASDQPKPSTVIAACRLSTAAALPLRHRPDLTIVFRIAGRTLSPRAW